LIAENFNRKLNCRWVLTNLHPTISAGKYKQPQHQPVDFHFMAVLHIITMRKIHWKSTKLQWARLLNIWQQLY